LGGVWPLAAVASALVVARAEAIPLRTGSVRAVVAAASFHWFHQPETIREIHRVLRPGGGLALLWNRRDESRPWTKALAALIESESRSLPRSRHEAWRALFEGPGGVGPYGFGALVSRSFDHVDHLPRDAVVDRVLSISAIGLLSPDRQAGLADQVRAILADDPEVAGKSEIDFPYRAEAFVARRDEDAGPGP